MEQFEIKFDLNNITTFDHPIKINNESNQN